MGGKGKVKVCVAGGKGGGGRIWRDSLYIYISERHS